MSYRYPYRYRPKQTNAVSDCFPYSLEAPLPRSPRKAPQSFPSFEIQSNRQKNGECQTADSLSCFHGFRLSPYPPNRFLWKQPCNIHFRYKWVQYGRRARREHSVTGKPRYRSSVFRMKGLHWQPKCHPYYNCNYSQSPYTEKCIPHSGK